MIRVLALFLSLSLLAACGGGGSGGSSGSGGGKLSSRNIGTLATIAAYAATEDEAEARRIGQAAGELAGATSPISPEVEQKLGEGVAVKTYAQMGPRYADESLQRYVNLVGRAVARQSARPDLLYSFAVIENDSPNAFAAPGGYVFVTTGALKAMNSEAELAGVLAHEIAHVTERHMLQIYRRTQLFNAGLMTAEAIEADNAKYRQGVDVATDTLFNKGLGSKFEFEADKVGLEYAALAGYDPQGLIDFLGRLGAQSKPAAGGWLGGTHPGTAQRVSQARAHSAAVLGGVGGQTLTDRFARNTASLRN